MDLSGIPALGLTPMFHGWGKVMSAYIISDITVKHRRAMDEYRLKIRKLGNQSPSSTSITPPRTK
jgi:hypothetical protein